MVSNWKYPSEEKLDFLIAQTVNHHITIRQKNRISLISVNGERKKNENNLEKLENFIHYLNINQFSFIIRKEIIMAKVEIENKQPTLTTEGKDIKLVIGRGWLRNFKLTLNKKEQLIADLEKILEKLEKVPKDRQKWNLWRAIYNIKPTHPPFKHTLRTVPYHPQSHVKKLANMHERVSLRS